MENVFRSLASVNVSEKVEEKAGLKYLSWAWAWAETKKLYPGMTSTVYETDNGCPYWTDGRTCWVKVGVTIEGLEHIEYFPIMDNRNQSILLGNLKSTDWNKAIQRALTKCIARHGLGISVYANEDLPVTATDDERAAAKQTKTLKERLEATRSQLSGDKVDDDDVPF